MPRVPYLTESNAQVSRDTLAGLKERRGGRLGHLDGVLLHSDPLTFGWNALFGALRSKMTLSARMSEIAIIRVGVVLRATYEVHHHRKIALKLGMTEAELDAIASWHQSECFSPSERAVLAYADAMTGSVQVPDEIFASVRKHFADRQIVELTATIAGYNMVSRLLEALQVAPESRDQPM